VLRTYFAGTVEVHDPDLPSGRVDALMAACGSLVGSMCRKPEIVTVGPRFNSGIIGNDASIGIRKDDAELEQAFDKALASHFEDGTTPKQ